MSKINSISKIPTGLLDKSCFISFLLEQYPDSIHSPFFGFSFGTPINTTVGRDNLGIFYDEAQKVGLDFRLVFGTLLGIYRNHNLITYDTDLDVAIHENQLHNLKLTITNLCTQGFSVIRSHIDPSGLVISILKKNVFIDIYVFSSSDDGFNKCDSYELSNEDFSQPSYIEFLGKNFKTVSNIEQFLLKYYGLNWKIEIKGKHACIKNNNNYNNNNPW